MKPTVGLPLPSNPAQAPDLSQLAETLSYFRQRVQETTSRGYDQMAAASRASRAPAVPRTAQIRYNPRTNKYVVGSEEFDANDIGALKALAEAGSLPEQQLGPGEQGFSVDEVAERFRSIYDNAEVDTSIQSRLRGMGEAIAGIPRGIASVFGADVANPLEGSADAWRRDNLTLREQAGRMHRPTESLVGAANAFGQAIETGVPVLAAGALGSLASPAGGIAAGIAVAGGMAAESQGDEAEARIAQALAQATPEQLQGNPEYMALRRAGNDHQSSVQELVRRGRTTAARYGAAIGGVSGAVAGPAGRFMARGLPMFGNRFAAGAGDDIGENLIRALRGTSGPGLTGTVRTGFAPALRSSAGLGVLGAGTEGTQEFFETDVSQGLADVSAGMSRGYQFNQYGTLDDFVGGAIGGAPFGAVGGLRTPTALPMRPTQQQQGTADPGLNAALGGAVAPQNPRTARQISASEALQFDRQNLRGPAPPAPARSDLFGGPDSPIRTPTLDPEDRMPWMGSGVTPLPPEEAEAQRAELVDYLRRLDAFIPTIGNPDMVMQAIQAREQALAELEALGPAPSPADVAPNQLGLPLRQQGPSAPVQTGEVGDLFGAPASRPTMVEDTSEIDGAPLAADPNQRGLFNRGGAPIYDERNEFTGFEGMGPEGPTPGFGAEPDGPRPPGAMGLRARREWQAAQQRQRAEASAANPAPLPDQYTPETEAPAAMAQERDQLERMLDERRAAGFAENDPVSTGITQRLAAIEQAIGPRGTQGALPLPATGQAPAAPTGLREVDAPVEDIEAAQEIDARVNAATATQPLFGPAGGATRGAKVPKNETAAESDRVITAQIKEMLDPNAGRDAVWISGKRAVPPAVDLPKKVRVVKTPAGTLLTTNAAKAKRLQSNPARANNEAEIGKLLNFPVSKAENAATGKPPVVVEGREKATGTPTTQVVVTEDTLQDGVDAVEANVNPETTEVGVTPIQESLAEREALVAAEAPGAAKAKQTSRAKVAPKVAPPPAPQEDEVKNIADTPEGMLAALEADLKKAVRDRKAARVKQLQDQIDTLRQQIADRGSSTPADEGSSSKGGLPRGETATTGGAPEGASVRGKTLAEETEDVILREEANLKMARDVFEALESEKRGDEPVVDLDLSPTATPAQTEVKVEGADAPVLSAAEMTVEVEGGESQVKPSAILDAFRKRIENLNLLKACLLK